MSADELMGLFILLQTVAVRLLLAHLDDEMTLESALTQLDRTFDFLRYGFIDTKAHA